MKTSQNTVLITGGGSGIGFELAKILNASGNRVIIAGRDKTRLESAVAELPGASYIQADIENQDDLDRLVQTIEDQFPALNILVNNAGSAHYYKLTDQNANAAHKAQSEMLTNYFAPIQLTEKLLPLLRNNQNAAIANVSSIVAIVPGITLPTYAASKAALHSYSQSLRLSLEREPADIKVFEVMPPLVNTAFSREIGGENGMDPKDVAQALVDGFANDVFEIRPGMTQQLYEAFLNSPENALTLLNS